MIETTLAYILRRGFAGIAKAHAQCFTVHFKPPGKFTQQAESVLVLVHVDQVAFDPVRS